MSTRVKLTRIVGSAISSAATKALRLPVKFTMYETWTLGKPGAAGVSARYRACDQWSLNTKAPLTKTALAKLERTIARWVGARNAKHMVKRLASGNLKVACRDLLKYSSTTSASSSGYRLLVPISRSFGEGSMPNAAITVDGRTYPDPNGRYQLQCPYVRDVTVANHLALGACRWGKY